MRFKCQCPCGCNYKTDIKQHIHKHHIYAKSKGGKNNSSNLIYLCPNCHYSHIFNNTKNHNIESEETYQLIGFLDSTSGICLEYKDFYGNIGYKFINR